MPGFKPNAAYIREMKKFGILPETLTPEDPVDPYATDEKYWRSFWLIESSDRLSHECELEVPQP